MNVTNIQYTTADMLAARQLQEAMGPGTGSGASVAHGQSSSATGAPDSGQSPSGAVPAASAPKAVLTRAIASPSDAAAATALAVGLIRGQWDGALAASSGQSLRPALGLL